MPRPPRLNESGTYHVINRGVERRNVFVEEGDYSQFMIYMGDLVTKYGIKIHAFCLMPNHYHILLETVTDNLSEALKYLNVNYSKYFNNTYQRSGHLWQGRFKSYLILDEIQLWTVAKYIERNPIAANIVASIENYPYQSYTLLRKANHPFYFLIEESHIHSMGISEYREYLDTQLKSESLKSVYKVYRINKDTQNKKHLEHSIASFFDTDTNPNVKIRECYQYGYTKTDIAEFLGLSKMQISRILVEKSVRHF
jgi:putative transposase